MCHPAVTICNVILNKVGYRNSVRGWRREKKRQGEAWHGQFSCFVCVMTSVAGILGNLLYPEPIDL